MNDKNPHFAPPELDGVLLSVGCLHGDMIGVQPRAKDFVIEVRTNNDSYTLCLDQPQLLAFQKLIEQALG